MPLNFEFKARSRNNTALEQKLQEFNPYFVGEDVQKDTYFHVAKGRLNLREGNIENMLIHYQRPDDQKQNNLMCCSTNTSPMRI